MFRWASRSSRCVDSSELDRETVLKIEKILGKRVRPEGRAGEFGPRFHLTVGEVFRNHVVGQPLPSETVDALLPLFKDIEVLSAPRVMARDGEKSQIKVMSYEYFWMGSSTDGSSRQSELQKVEIGTKVDLTSHIGDHNEVTMEIRVEIERPASAFRRRGRAGCTKENGASDRHRAQRPVRHSWRVDGGRHTAPDKDGESVYIMAIPTIVEPPAVDNDANGLPLGMGGMGGFREPPGHVDTGIFADP